MYTDPIADLLTRIRNASQVGHPSVLVPASKKKEQVLEVLRDEGYIESFEVEKSEEGHSNLRVFLRYGGPVQRPVVREIKRLSRPGRRVYCRHQDIPRCRGGLGVLVLATSKGMLSDREARRLGVGGELICSVF